MPITPPKRNKFTIQNTKYTFPFTNSPSTITYTKFTVHYHIHQIHHPKKQIHFPLGYFPLYKITIHHHVFQIYHPPPHLPNSPSKIPSQMTGPKHNLEMRQRQPSQVKTSELVSAQKRPQYCVLHSTNISNRSQRLISYILMIWQLRNLASFWYWDIRYS